MSNIRLDDLLDGSTADGFLREKFLYWLEALSLMRDMPKGVLAIEKLHGFFQVPYCRPLPYPAS